MTINRFMNGILSGRGTETRGDGAFVRDASAAVKLGKRPRQKHNVRALERFPGPPCRQADFPPATSRRTASEPDQAARARVHAPGVVPSTARKSAMRWA
ncbi:hypothetical protein ASNO1_18850 [Corallococcus caeni]|uniref:Uncharacterized protein n=1 Tax=Corallococcus caeni TaxID=3082388 RepID=A0ABQ6QP77_9BACT|nr:hypothetical protein ASNO1_18850 [Corallococcus sp. NO1]